MKKLKHGFLKHGFLRMHVKQIFNSSILIFKKCNFGNDILWPSFFDFNSFTFQSLTDWIEKMIEYFHWAFEYWVIAYFYCKSSASMGTDSWPFKEPAKTWFCWKRRICQKNFRGSEELPEWSARDRCNFRHLVKV